MPRISELPENVALTGNEILSIVQEGETRKTSISALLATPKVPSLNNARWIQSSEQEGLLNESSLSTDSAYLVSGFSAMAVVDCVKNDNDVLLWGHLIEPGEPTTVDDYSYIGEYSDGGQIFLSEGTYSINLSSYGPNDDGAASYSINGGASLSLVEVGLANEITVALGDTATVFIAATNGALVRCFKNSGFSYGGESLPLVFAADRQITVFYPSGDYLKNIVFTATARIYRDNLMVAESSVITLTVTNSPPNNNQQS